MTLIDELYALFRRNFPYIIREEATARAILAHPDNHYIERRDDSGRLYAASVVNANAIILLAVDEDRRKTGVGSALLAESEACICANGHDSVVIGAGFDYLCPGVPVREKPHPETLLRENIDPRIPENNASFFIKRGYRHSWNDCNCFDMRQPMENCVLTEHNIGDTVSGVLYRWAEPSDYTGVLACTDDAEPNFTKYYAAGDFYREDSPERTLIALIGDEVVGTLVVSRETEAAGVGSIGCTAVKSAYQGRHIASNMIMLGAKSLHAAGMKEGYLGYTYSGLDKLYGRAGYAVSALYFMAEKALG